MSMPVDFQRMVEDLKGAEHDLGVLRARVHSALNAPTGAERQEHYYEADSAYTSHPGTAAMSTRVGHPPSLGRSYPSPCLCALFCVCFFVVAGCVASGTTMPNTSAVWTSTPVTRHGRGHEGAPALAFGAWDSHAVISTLQLTVVVALALGVDERHVHVYPMDNHFFRVRILSEGEWLQKYILDAPDDVLVTLNNHAARFSAKLVITHQPALEAANATT